MLFPHNTPAKRKNEKKKTPHHRVKISTQTYEKLAKINIFFILVFNLLINQYPVKMTINQQQYMHSYTPILLKLKPYDREKITTKYQINSREHCFQVQFPTITNQKHQRRGASLRSTFCGFNVYIFSFYTMSHFSQSSMFFFI